MDRKLGAALGVGILAIVLPVVVLIGGVRTLGEEHATLFSVPTEGAERARVVLDPGGDLRLARGSAGLLDGTFRSNLEDAEPDVDYRVVSREGVARLEQGGGGVLLPWDASDAEHAWDLLLSGRLPLAIEADLGSGRGELDLNGLDLLSLDVEAGSGGATVDLSGPRVRAFAGTIRAGSGDLDVILPRGVGARVTLVPGSGAVDPTTLSRDGDTVTNSAFAISKVTIDLTIEGGSGTITLRQQADPTFSTPTPPA